MNDHRPYRKAEARLMDQHVPDSGWATAKATIICCTARWTSSGESRTTVERGEGHTEETKRSKEHTIDPGTLQFNHKTQGHGKVFN